MRTEKTKQKKTKSKNMNTILCKKRNHISRALLRTKLNCMVGETILLLWLNFILAESCTHLSCTCTPPMPRFILACTNCMHDFLLGVLQHMAFICNLTESMTGFKFHSWKPKHLPFRRIFVANSTFFSFSFIWFSIWIKNRSLFS